MALSPDQKQVIHIPSGENDYPFSAFNAVLTGQVGVPVDVIYNADRWSGQPELIASLDHFAYEDLVVMLILLKAVGVEGPYVIGARHQTVFEDNAYFVQLLEWMNITPVSLYGDANDPGAEAAQIKKMIKEMTDKVALLFATGNRLGPYSPLMGGITILACLKNKAIYPYLHLAIQGSEPSRSINTLSSEQRAEYSRQVQATKDYGGVAINLGEPLEPARTRPGRRDLLDKLEAVRIQLREELHSLTIEKALPVNSH